MRITHVNVLVVLVMIICGGWSVDSAQKPGYGNIPGLKPQPKSNGKTREVSGRPQIRIPTLTTGSLTVSAEASADLLVEPLKLAKPQRGQKPEVLTTTVPATGVFIFNDLKPGLYRVAGTLAKHYPNETTIDIKANKTSALRLDFPPIIYSLTINTNVATGDVKYALEGEPLSRVAAILNGKVRLSVPEGKYTIAISTGEFGYEIKRQTILINKDQILEMKLDRIIISKDSFSANWTSSGLQEWEMPAGWQDVTKRLRTKGAGVALPRQQGYRHYKDFKLTSTAKMNNGVALSFAVRAQDSSNYYLVQLTGAKSDDPHMVRLFLVNNGSARRIMGIPIPASAARAMDSEQFVTVSIRMIDYHIDVQLTDTQEGVAHPLGRLTDPEHILAVGAPGIVVRDNEENLIGPFAVCADADCMRQ